MAESVRVIPTFIAPAALPASRALRPTAGEWIRHSFLLAATILSTTIAGVMTAPEVGDLDVAMADPSKLTDYLFYIPEYYLRSVARLLGYAIQHPPIVLQGLTFSA